MQLLAARPHTGVATLALATCLPSVVGDRWQSVLSMHNGSGLHGMRIMA